MSRSLTQLTNCGQVASGFFCLYGFSLSTNVSQAFYHSKNSTAGFKHKV